MSSRARVLWVIPIVFLGYFFLYPLARILILGLTGPASAGSLWERLADVGWFTLGQAALSTFLTLAVATPLTWALSNFRFRGRRLVLSLVTVPFVLPTVVVGAAFRSLGFEESLIAILAAHVFFNVAVVVRTVSSLWSRLDPALVQAARVLGATPWHAFRKVTLPLIAPAIAAAASIVFLFTFTSFGVVLILGGYEYATIEVEIYRQAVDIFDLRLAAGLAIAQMVAVVGALILYRRFQRDTGRSWALQDVRHLATPVGWDRARVRAAAVVTMTLLAIPLANLVWRGWTTGGFARLAQEDPIAGDPIRSIANSLSYAVVATALATLLGLLIATLLSRGGGRAAGILDISLMLPLGTSAVTIGFGFIVALGWPIDLRASWLLVPIAHALVGIPFVVRSTLPTLKAVPADVRAAAATLGASPWRVWRRIDLPIVSRALMVGAGFSLAISLGEFGATSFIARPESTTMPVMILRLLSRPGQQSFGMAMAMAAILAAVTALVVFVADRARTDDLGVF